MCIRDSLHLLGNVLVLVHQLRHGLARLVDPVVGVVLAALRRLLELLQLLERHHDLARALELLPRRRINLVPFVARENRRQQLVRDPLQLFDFTGEIFDQLERVLVRPLPADFYCTLARVPLLDLLEQLRRFDQSVDLADLLLAH